MTSQIQISKKLADDSIVVIGGADAATFTANVEALLGADAAEAVLRTFDHLAPLAATAGYAPAPTVQQVAQQFAQPAPQAAPAGAPGPAPIGSNGRPQKWVPAGVSKKTGRAYNGFWADDNPRY